MPCPAAPPSLRSTQRGKPSCCHSPMTPGPSYSGCCFASEDEHTCVQQPHPCLCSHGSPGLQCPLPVDRANPYGAESLLGAWDGVLPPTCSHTLACPPCMSCPGMSWGLLEDQAWYPGAAMTTWPWAQALTFTAHPPCAHGCGHPVWSLWNLPAPSGQHGGTAPILMINNVLGPQGSERGGRHGGGEAAWEEGENQVYEMVRRHQSSGSPEGVSP